MPADLRDPPIFPCFADKTPACPRGFYDATTDPERQAALWAGRTDLLVAIPTGEVSGLSVLDIDRAGIPWLDQHRDQLFTRWHQTRSGGRHYVFEHQPGLRCSISRIAPGVDVRAEGGYFIAWDRHGYAVGNAPITPWPDWLQPPDAVDQAVDPSTLSSYGSPRTAPAPVDAVSISILVTHIERNFPRRDTGYREYIFALRATQYARSRLASTPVGLGIRDRNLNAEAYALGRLVARGWVSGGLAAEALWDGACSNGYVRDHGERQTLRTIQNGLLAGIEKPYPDL